MKKIALVFMICCMCTACGTKETTVADASKQTEVTTEATVAEQTEAATEAAVAEQTEATTGVTITPLPTTIKMEELDNCTLAVSFEEGDAYVDDTGAMQLDVTVYTYDLYDMVDIANLKVGDIIMIQGTEVPVESMETLESGLLFINGGMDNGGYDLWHNDSGVYFEHGYNDAKSYYPIGEATLRVSGDFKFVDSSDPDKGEVTYYPGDLLTKDAGISYYFFPNNTSIVVENGQITHMTRIFTP